MFSNKMLAVMPRAQTLRRLAWMLLPLIVFVVLSAIALIHPTATWTSLAISAGAIVPLAMIVAACYGNAPLRPFRAGFAIAAGSYFIFFMLFPASSWLENFPTSQALGFGYAKLFPNSQTNPLASWNYGGFFGGGGGFGGGGFGGGGAFFVADDANSSNDSSDSKKGSDDSDPNVNPFGVRANSSYGSTTTTFSTTSPTNTGAATAQQKLQDDYAAAHNFWIIGHSVWALIFGWVGGCWAQFLAKRQRGKGEDEGTR